MTVIKDVEFRDFDDDGDVDMYIDFEAGRRPNGNYFYRWEVDNAMVETKKKVRIR